VTVETQTHHNDDPNIVETVRAVVLNVDADLGTGTLEITR
jgi:hypothetical protein